jgi:CheY-like chemotaxis protein
MREIYLQDLLAGRASGNAGHSFAITRFPYVIGRQPDGDARFGALWVSRRHCRFFLLGDEVWLEDLGSRNGTTLNGEFLTCPRPVREGDRIEMAGMAFQVRLPAAVGAAPVLSTQEHCQAAPRKQLRQQILVVDNNANTAETLAMLLRQWGHEVAVAHDGPEAVSLAQESHPKTVLLDMALPGMDGYEVARRLRTQVGLREALLIALTGCQDEGNPNRFRDAGLHALLAKPIAPDALRELIDWLPN